MCKEKQIVEYLKFCKSHPLIFSNKNASFKIITDYKIITSWQSKKREELKREYVPLSRSDIGILIDDPYVLVIRDLVEFPNGKMNGYIRIINRSYLEGKQGVVIFPCYKDKILLLHQFRHATRSWHLEIPRGFGTPKISHSINARKEIAEEIGGSIANLIDLGMIHSNTGLEGHSVRLFFAELSSFNNPNKSEGIDRIELVSKDVMESFIMNGKITDGFTIIAYTLANLKGYI